MGLTLSDHQIRILLKVPFVFDAESGCIFCDIDELLLESKFADFSRNQNALLSLLDQVEMEFFLGGNDFLFNEVVFRTHFKLGLLIFN